MIRHPRLEHRFVRNVSESLAPGVLYISIEYATAAHSCCCGCGEEVVTPFSPTDWKMTFDGETISLSPSIGNWLLPCRSHYVIKRGRIIEAGPWTDEEVAAERQRDSRAKAAFYGTGSATPPTGQVSAAVPGARNKDSIWRRLARWVLK